jgi:hypothetical protein
LELTNSSASAGTDLIKINNIQILNELGTTGSHINFIGWAEENTQQLVMYIENRPDTDGITKAFVTLNSDTGTNGYVYFTFDFIGKKVA